MIARRPKRNTKLYKLIAAVVIFTAFVVSLTIFHFATLNEKVPDLSGLNLKQAKIKAGDTSFKLKVTGSKFSKKFKKGLVVSQEPSFKKSMRKGSLIFIVLSKGPKKPLVKKIAVPDIKNKPYQDANKILVELGFMVTIKKSTSPEKEKGLVIAQNPSKGSKVKKGSRVTLLVGKGQGAAAVVNKNKDISTSTIICIDPGHQTKADLSGEPVGPGSASIKAKVSGGATGISTGIPEYKTALAISLKLKSLLQNKGYNVIMTRESNDVNISNIERAQIANKARAALFVRIHADSNTNRSMHGYSVLYPAKNKWTGNIYNQSKAAAKVVSDKLTITGARNNGIVPRGDLTGFNWSKVPTFLVESGFLSNPSEDRSLNNSANQQKIAQGIFNGIINFLSK